MNHKATVMSVLIFLLCGLKLIDNQPASASIAESTLTNPQMFYDEALEDAGISIDRVKLYVVPRSHYLLRGTPAGLVAYAAGVTGAPHDYIIVVNTSSRELRSNPDMLRRVMRHEVAHIIAWETHGQHIGEHGREFVVACRSLLSGSDKNKECRNHNRRF